MSMLKREMQKGLRCYVSGHAIAGDNTSPVIDSRGKILKSPVLSTVLIELDTPPEGIPKQYNVPIDCVYWAKQK